MKDNCTLRLLSQTPNGKIFKCRTCHKVHIEYKNLNFVFEREEFEFFRKFFLNLDPEHWESINKNSIYNRKIMVPIGHKNFTIMFNTREIYELKSMLYNMFNVNKELSFIGSSDIELQINFN